MTRRTTDAHATAPLGLGIDMSDTRRKPPTTGHVVTGKAKLVLAGVLVLTAPVLFVTWILFLAFVVWHLRPPTDVAELLKWIL